MFFYFALAGVAYFVYISTFADYKQAENKSARDHYEGGILLDVVRSQNSLSSIVEGSDEIIRTKLARGPADINVVKSSIDKRKAMTTQFTKKHRDFTKKLSDKLTHVAPTEDFNSPNMTALSPWYVKAVGKVQAPVINPLLQ